MFGLLLCRSDTTLPFPTERHPKHNQEQRKRDNRTRPSNLVIYRPPIDQIRKVTYFSGIIQLVSRAAVNVVEKRIRNLGNAEAQCRCGERQDDDCRRQPSGQSTSMKDIAFFRGKGGGSDDNSVEGQQRQSFSVENGQNFIKGFHNFVSVRWTD